MRERAHRAGYQPRCVPTDWDRERFAEVLPDLQVRYNDMGFTLKWLADKTGSPRYVLATLLREVKLDHIRGNCWISAIAWKRKRTLY